MERKSLESGKKLRGEFGGMRMENGKALPAEPIHR